MANQGTVFLDEDREMSRTYSQLLRFLNDGSFRRVGGDREVKVNVRILSATHRDLEKLVIEGSFREDLFYRLNVLNVEVPPLRERGQDILCWRVFHAAGLGADSAPGLPSRTGTYPALLGNPGRATCAIAEVIFRAAAICGKQSGGHWRPRHLPALPLRVRSTATLTAFEQAVEGFEKSLLEKLYASYPSTRQCQPPANLAHRHRPSFAQIRHPNKS